MFPEKGLGGYITGTDAPGHSSYKGFGDDSDAANAEIFPAWSGPSTSDSRANS